MTSNKRKFRINEEDEPSPKLQKTGDNDTTNEFNEPLHNFKVIGCYNWHIM